MPRVLIISYYFPPAGGPGVQRVMSFVRHLPASGWEPIVLTVEGGTFFNRDDAGLARVPPNLRVYRVPTIEPFALYNRLRGRPTEEALPVGNVGQGERKGIVGRIASYVRANVFVPDARIGWIPFATRAGIDVARREHADAILTSGPPHTVHLIGRKVAEKTGLPWVADFRDPWTKIYYNAELPRMRVARRLDERFEASVVRRATRLATVNALVRDSLGPAAAGATIVMNGYEEDDFRGSVAPDLDRFTIVYVGNLIPQEDTATLFRVLGDMAASDGGFRDALRLRFVGKVHPGVRAELDAEGIGECASFAGFVPHDEAVRAMRRAPVLLFVGVGNLISAKIFEYAASGRPIIALAPIGGDVDRLLAEARIPGVIEHGDAEGIRGRLRELYGAWRTHSLPARVPMSGVEGYSRAAQASRMAATLDAAFGRSVPPENPG